MTSLMFGQLVRDPVPVDENTVRNTAVPVYDDDPPAVAPDTPDTNELETDPNPHLGLASRTMGSHVIPTDKYVPSWIPEVDDNHNLTDRINSRIGNVGTAAGREEAGQYGHGTMQVLIGIEPTGDLSGAGGMTNNYFVREPRNIQDGSPASMQPPPGADYTVPGQMGAVGKAAARDATASSYQSFYDALAG